MPFCCGEENILNLGVVFRFQFSVLGFCMFVSIGFHYIVSAQDIPGIQLQTTSVIAHILAFE